MTLRKPVTLIIEKVITNQPAHSQPCERQVLLCDFSSSPLVMLPSTSRVLQTSVVRDITGEQVKTAEEIIDGQSNVVEVTDEQRKTAEVMDEQPKIADIMQLPQSARVMDEQPKSAEVTDEQVKTADEVMDGQPKTAEVMDEQPKAVEKGMDAQPERAEVNDVQPKSAEVLHEQPKSAEVLDEQPKTVEGIMDEQQKSAEIMDEHRKTAEVMDETPQSIEVSDERPKSAEFLDKQPKRPEVLDKRPKSVKDTDEQLKSVEVIDKQPKSVEKVQGVNIEASRVSNTAQCPEIAQKVDKLMGESLADSANADTTHQGVRSETSGKVHEEGETLSHTEIPNSAEHESTEDIQEEISETLSCTDIVNTDEQEKTEDESLMTVPLILPTPTSRLRLQNLNNQLPDCPVSVAIPKEISVQKNIVWGTIVIIPVNVFPVNRTNAIVDSIRAIVVEMNDETVAICADVTPLDGQDTHKANCEDANEGDDSRNLQMHGEEQDHDGRDYSTADDCSKPQNTNEENTSDNVRDSNVHAEEQDSDATDDNERRGELKNTTTRGTETMRGNSESPNNANSHMTKICSKETNRDDMKFGLRRPVVVLKDILQDKDTLKRWNVKLKGTGQHHKTGNIFRHHQMNDECVFPQEQSSSEYETDNAQSQSYLKTWHTIKLQWEDNTEEECQVTEMESDDENEDYQVVYITECSDDENEECEVQDSDESNDLKHDADQNDRSKDADKENAHSSPDIQKLEKRALRVSRENMLSVCNDLLPKLAAARLRLKDIGTKWNARRNKSKSVSTSSHNVDRSKTPDTKSPKQKADLSVNEASQSVEHYNGPIDSDKPMDDNNNNVSESHHNTNAMETDADEVAPCQFQIKSENYNRTDEYHDDAPQVNNNIEQTQGDVSVPSYEHIPSDVLHMQQYYSQNSNTVQSSNSNARNVSVSDIVSEQTTSQSMDATPSLEDVREGFSSMVDTCFSYKITGKIPKKRGRPPMAETCLKKKITGKVPRKRGRPKKDESATSKATHNKKTNNRKDKSPEHDSTEPASKQKNTQNKRNSSPEQHGNIMPKPKKKRGRKRKSDPSRNPTYGSENNMNFCADPTLNTNFQLNMMFTHSSAKQPRSETPEELCQIVTQSPSKIPSVDSAPLLTTLLSQAHDEKHDQPGNHQVVTQSPSKIPSVSSAPLLTTLLSQAHDEKHDQPGNHQVLSQKTSTKKNTRCYGCKHSKKHCTCHLDKQSHNKTPQGEVRAPGGMPTSCKNAFSAAISSKCHCKHCELQSQISQLPERTPLSIVTAQENISAGTKVSCTPSPSIRSPAKAPEVNLQPRLPLQECQPSPSQVRPSSTSPPFVPSRLLQPYPGNFHAFTRPHEEGLRVRIPENLPPGGNTPQLPSPGSYSRFPRQGQETPSPGNPANVPPRPPFQRTSPQMFPRPSPESLPTRSTENLPQTFHNGVQPRFPMPHPSQFSVQQYQGFQPFRVPPFPMDANFPVGHYPQHNSPKTSPLPEGSVAQFRPSFPPNMFPFPDSSSPQARWNQLYRNTHCGRMQQPFFSHHYTPQTMPPGCIPQHSSNKKSQQQAEIHQRILHGSMDKALSGPVEQGLKAFLRGMPQRREDQNMHINPTQENPRQDQNVNSHHKEPMPTSAQHADLVENHGRKERGEIENGTVTNTPDQHALPVLAQITFPNTRSFLKDSSASMKKKKKASSKSYESTEKQADVLPVTPISEQPKQKRRRKKIADVNSPMKPQPQGNDKVNDSCDIDGTLPGENTWDYIEELLPSQGSGTKSESHETNSSEAQHQDANTVESEPQVINTRELLSQDTDTTLAQPQDINTKKVPPQIANAEVQPQDMNTTEVQPQGVQQGMNIDGTQSQGLNTSKVQPQGTNSAKLQTKDIIHIEEQLHTGTTAVQTQVANTAQEWQLQDVDRTEKEQPFGARHTNNTELEDSNAVGATWPKVAEAAQGTNSLEQQRHDVHSMEQTQIEGRNITEKEYQSIKAEEEEPPNETSPVHPVIEIVPDESYSEMSVLNHVESITGPVLNWDTTDNSTHANRDGVQMFSTTQKESTEITQDSQSSSIPSSSNGIKEALSTQDSQSSSIPCSSNGIKEALSQVESHLINSGQHIASSPPNSGLNQTSSNVLNPNSSPNGLLWNQYPASSIGQTVNPYPNSNSQPGNRHPHPNSQQMNPYPSPNSQQMNPYPSPNSQPRHLFPNNFPTYPGPHGPPVNPYPQSVNNLSVGTAGNPYSNSRPGNQCPNSSSQQVNPYSTNQTANTAMNPYLNVNNQQGNHHSSPNNPPADSAVNPLPSPNSQPQNLNSTAVTNQLQNSSMTPLQCLEFINKFFSPVPSGCGEPEHDKNHGGSSSSSQAKQPVNPFPSSRSQTVNQYPSPSGQQHVQYPNLVNHYHIRNTEQGLPSINQIRHHPEHMNFHPAQRQPHPEQRHLHPQQRYPHSQQTYPHPEQRHPHPEQRHPHPEQRHPHPEQTCPHPEETHPSSKKSRSRKRKSCVDETSGHSWQRHDMGHLHQHMVRMNYASDQYWPRPLGPYEMQHMFGYNQWQRFGNGIEPRMYPHGGPPGTSQGK